MLRRDWKFKNYLFSKPFKSKKDKSLFFVFLFFTYIITASVCFAESKNKDFKTYKVHSGIIFGKTKPIYYIDNFLPLFEKQNYLGFLDIRVSLKNSSTSNEENVGFGVRKLFFDSFIIGGNFYYDTYLSLNKKRHNQIGAGVELLSGYFDLISNFYFPVSSKKYLSSTTYHEFKSKTLVKISETLYEEALKGFDYEVGFLVPCISKYFDTRLYVGGYHYYPSDSKRLDGVKTRIEFKPFKFFTLNIGWSNDDFSTSRYFADCRFTFFFGKDDKSRRFNFYRQNLYERMTDPINRDINVMAQKRLERQEEIVIDGLLYVDSQNQTGIEDGSLQYPYRSIQQAINNAYNAKWIFIRKGIYEENITLSDDVVLWGAGYSLFDTIEPTEMPILRSKTEYVGNVIKLANNNEIMGLRIEKGNVGIYGENVKNIKIHHNQVKDNRTYNIWFKSDKGEVSDITISDNILENSLINDNVILATYSSSSILKNIWILRNQISKGGDEGLDFYFANKSTTENIFIRNNLIKDNFDNGVSILTASGTIDISTIIFEGNTITNNNNSGIRIKIGNANYKDIIIGDNEKRIGGYNSLYNNKNFDLNNEFPVVINLKAENNWWGSSQGPSPSKIANNAYVDYEPFLTYDPNN